MLSIPVPPVGHDPTPPYQVISGGHWGWCHWQGPLAVPEETDGSSDSERVRRQMPPLDPDPPAPGVGWNEDLESTLVRLGSALETALDALGWQ